MADFDKLWNYNDPAATEIKFREVLANSSPQTNLSHHLQLLTQIARTFSLRAKFTEAHQALDEVKEKLPAQPETAHARYHLERGRTYNSAGNKDEAKTHFEQAKQIALQVEEDGYVVDAIHMLAIVAGANESVALNEEAILYAENSNSDDAKRWLGSLYNNLAWSYFDKGDYEKALSIFLRALKWFEDRKSTSAIFIAKWSVARALRALNKLDEAITIQLGLFEETLSTGEPDGYVHEELGELFLLKNDKLKSSFHFGKAYEFLSADKYLQQNEKERLDRMKQLSS